MWRDKNVATHSGEGMQLAVELSFCPVSAALLWHCAAVAPDIPCTLFALCNAFHAAHYEDPLAARMANLDQGFNKKKKKAGCMSFLSPKASKKRTRTRDQDPVDIGAGISQIPGGLAGIRARMAEMGHHMNAPEPPPAMGQQFGDFAPGDEFEADAAPAGPNAPAHRETMSGEGFVLMSDFCTENGKHANVKRQSTAPAARRKDAARGGREGRVQASQDSFAERNASASAVPARAPSPDISPSPDILSFKNEDGTEMTAEQMLNFFMPPSQPATKSPASLPSTIIAASNNKTATPAATIALALLPPTAPPAQEKGEASTAKRHTYACALSPA